MPITQEELVETFLVGMLETMTRRYYLPFWAESSLDGEWVQYAQLSTKDGRRMGNSIILAVDTVMWGEASVELFTIITDFGNVLRLTESELEDQFHPPKWKMHLVWI
jgi:hypothetical protein